MTPYVYKIIHKDTKKYYIGSKYAGWRNNNEVTALIGDDYYTSSTNKFITETFTKERVQDWDIYIIYKTRGDEHDPIAEAVAHENLFIGMHISDELCLNKSYIDPYLKTVVLYDMNEEAEKARIEKIKKTKAKRTPEQKAETSRKLSERGRNRTPKQEAERIRKQKATKAKRTPEQKAETSRKLSQAYAQLSLEEKAARIARQRATKAQRTPEQEAERIRKMNATKNRLGATIKQGKDRAPVSAKTRAKLSKAGLGRKVSPEATRNRLASRARNKAIKQLGLIIYITEMFSKG